MAQHEAHTSFGDIPHDCPERLKTGFWQHANHWGVATGEPLIEAPLHEQIALALPLQIGVTGFPVGVGTTSYKEQAVHLRPGDRLLLYTDGVTEARNADGEHFGIGRLLAALEQSRRSSLDKSLDGLVESVEGWSGETPRHHDFSILFVERTEPTGTATAEPIGTCREPSLPSDQPPIGNKVP